LEGHEVYPVGGSDLGGAIHLCENGGHCRLMGAADAFTASVQSGKLFQQCVCPEGYAGMGCELPAMTCDNGSCPDGSSCTDDDQCRCNLYDHRNNSILCLIRVICALRSDSSLSIGEVEDKLMKWFLRALCEI